MAIKQLLGGAIALAIIGVLAVSTAGAGSADATQTRTYRVTIENLTPGQPLSPPVAATHRPGETLFRVGHDASGAIESIAEDGDNSFAVAALGASPGVTQALDVGTPITPQGSTAGGFADTVTFDIQARPGDRLSLATMLICTNDGITGLDTARLPRHGSETFYLDAYDAGTEDNTQNSLDIVDPCSGIGPVPLAGDPNGNFDAGVDTNPAQPIHMHPGIHGSGDLNPAGHGWTGPVAMVTVERIS